MAKFRTYDTFLGEEEVPLSTDLEDYEVESLGDGKFSFTVENSKREFSVLPPPKDIREYEAAFEKLTESMESGIPERLYATLDLLQKMPYDFGNLVSDSLSLENVQKLELSLDDKQRASLKSSPTDFLRDQFSTLGKDIKAATLSYLKKRSQMYAIALECLFYHLRTQKDTRH